MSDEIVWSLSAATFVALGHTRYTVKRVRFAVRVDAKITSRPLATVTCRVATIDARIDDARAIVESAQSTRHVGKARFCAAKPSRQTLHVAVGRIERTELKTAAQVNMDAHVTASCRVTHVRWRSSIRPDGCVHDARVGDDDRVGGVRSDPTGVHRVRGSVVSASQRRERTGDQENQNGRSHTTTVDPHGRRRNEESRLALAVKAGRFGGCTNLELPPACPEG